MCCFTSSMACTHDDDIVLLVKHHAIFLCRKSRKSYPECLLLPLRRLVHPEPREPDKDRAKSSHEELAIPAPRKPSLTPTLLYLWHRTAVHLSASSLPRLRFCGTTERS